MQYIAPMKMNSVVSNIMMCMSYIINVQLVVFMLLAKNLLF
jgi:hypothetical protein